MPLHLKSYYSRPGGFLHFLSVLFFTSDSVHLCGGGEFYSGQDLRDTFQVTFKSQHGGRSSPPAPECGVVYSGTHKGRSGR